MHACGNTAACTHKLLKSTSSARAAPSACFQQLAVAGCSFSLLQCLLASSEAGTGAPLGTGGSPTVRTADFVDATELQGTYRRVLELLFRFDIALALVQRRLDSRQLSCFVEDLSQPSDPEEATRLAENVFLSALPLACPAEPAALTVPLGVLQALLASITTEEGIPSSAAAACAIVPPACVQLLVARATARQHALPTVRAIAEKMCSWKCFAVESQPLPAACGFYVAGAVALYMHADGADTCTLAGASLRPIVDVAQHHCSREWAPLLSCFAGLEQMAPARCVGDHPHGHVAAATIDLVRSMGRGCSGDTTRSFAAIAVGAWWLLEGSARPHVSAMLLARLCEDDARITAAMADALQAVHAASDRPLEHLLAAHPDTLKQISSQLIKRPNVRLTFFLQLSYLVAPAGMKLWAAACYTCFLFHATLLRFMHPRLRRVWRFCRTARN